MRRGEDYVCRDEEGRRRFEREAMIKEERRHRCMEIVWVECVG
jgi:hypothetical protein